MSGESFQTWSKQHHTASCNGEKSVVASLEVFADSVSAEEAIVKSVSSCDETTHDRAESKGDIERSRGIVGNGGELSSLMQNPIKTTEQEEDHEADGDKERRSAARLLATTCISDDEEEEEYRYNTDACNQASHHVVDHNTAKGEIPGKEPLKTAAMFSTSNAHEYSYPHYTNNNTSSFVDTGSLYEDSDDGGFTSEYMSTHTAGSAGSSGEEDVWMDENDDAGESHKDEEDGAVGGRNSTEKKMERRATQDKLEYKPRDKKSSSA